MAVVVVVVVGDFVLILVVFREMMNVMNAPQLQSHVKVLIVG